MNTHSIASRITRPFYFGAYHVTRGQFRNFVEDTGYKTFVERGEGFEPGVFGFDTSKTCTALSKTPRGEIRAMCKLTSTPWS